MPSLLRRARARLRRPPAPGVRLPEGLRLPEGYVARIPPEYFDDAGRVDADIVHQPDVYEAAARIARVAGATHLVDVGCGAGEKLLPHAPEFTLVGVDYGPNLEHVRATAPEHTWIGWDAEGGEPLRLPDGVAERSVVICADVIEHLVDPAGLLTALGELAEQAVAVLVSTPDRALVRPPGDLGPPGNPAHVREWTLDELVALLGDGGLAPTFAGHTVNNSRDRLKRTSLCIVEARRHRTIAPAPPDFRVTAIVTAYNEGDVIESALRDLAAQGCHVHLVDNHSTDDTVARAQALGLGDRLTVERFPADGPTGTYDWEALLRNVEAVARRTGGWVMHMDADELRRTPWDGVSLRDGLHHVHARGFTAVDFTSMVFVPVDDSFAPGGDLWTGFSHFEFGGRPGHFIQVKAWNADAGAAEIAPSGGHEAVFPGRRVFPYKFLQLHYPIRSQAHGERKVFADRAARWNAEERARGWHVQYDRYAPGTSFLRDPAELLEWDPATFGREYLTERLTGVGIPRTG
ncbi:MAG: glycosyltransferase family 2 protein [Solirubrobacterales bacterium]|nr:glycosyltransferase family 2 protein [Solirubrobacterales bacterium]